ncbi:MAG: hypothetical protein AB7O43_13480 [Hyphomicrobiaceae bacterium]
MVIDRLSETARAAGFAMVGSEDLINEHTVQPLPDMPAPRETSTAPAVWERSRSTALVPASVRPVPGASNWSFGWSMFWKAPA